MLISDCVDRYKLKPTDTRKHLHRPRSASLSLLRGRAKHGSVRRDLNYPARGAWFRRVPTRGLQET